MTFYRWHWVAVAAVVAVGKQGRLKGITWSDCSGLNLLGDMGCLFPLMLSAGLGGTIEKSWMMRCVEWSVLSLMKWWVC